MYDVNEVNAEETSASTAVVRDLSDIEDRATGGSGVDIYGIDTGIYTAHTSFGGRASLGAVSNSHTLFCISPSMPLLIRLSVVMPTKMEMVMALILPAQRLAERTAWPPLQK